MVKLCRCGREYTKLPETAKYFDDWKAYYFDCLCLSTLVVPVHIPLAWKANRVAEEKHD